VGKWGGEGGGFRQRRHTSSRTHLHIPPKMTRASASAHDDDLYGIRTHSHAGDILLLLPPQQLRNPAPSHRHDRWARRVPGGARHRGSPDESHDIGPVFSLLSLHPPVPLDVYIRGGEGPGGVPGREGGSGAGSREGREDQDEDQYPSWKMGVGWSKGRRRCVQRLVVGGGSLGYDALPFWRCILFVFLVD